MIKTPANRLGSLSSTSVGRWNKALIGPTSSTIAKIGQELLDGLPEFALSRASQGVPQMPRIAPNRHANGGQWSSFDHLIGPMFWLRGRAHLSQHLTSHFVCLVPPKPWQAFRRSALQRNMTSDIFNMVKCLYRISSLTCKFIILEMLLGCLRGRSWTSYYVHYLDKFSPPTLPQIFETSTKTLAGSLRTTSNAPAHCECGSSM